MHSRVEITWNFVILDLENLEKTWNFILKSPDNHEFWKKVSENKCWMIIEEENRKWNFKVEEIENLRENTERVQKMIGKLYQI